MKDLAKIARWKHSVEKMQPREVGVTWVAQIVGRKLERLRLSEADVNRFADDCLKTARMAVQVPRSLNPAFDGQQRLDFMASRLNPEFARLMSDAQLIIETRCTNLHKASTAKLESFWSGCNELVGAIVDLESGLNINDANPAISDNLAWSIKYTLYRLLCDIKGKLSFREVHEFYLYFVNHPSVIEALDNDGKFVFRRSKSALSPERDTKLYNCIYDPICLASMQLQMPYECKQCGDAGKVNLNKWRENGSLYRYVLDFFKEKRRMRFQDFRAVNEYWTAFWQKHPEPKHAPSLRLFAPQRTKRFLN